VVTLSNTLVKIGYRFSRIKFRQICFQMNLVRIIIIIVVMNPVSLAPEVKVLGVTPRIPKNYSKNVVVISKMLQPDVVKKGFIKNSYSAYHQILTIHIVKNRNDLKNF